MRIILIIATLFTTACAHNSEKLKNNVQLLEGFKAQQYSNIYFAGQPPIEKFDQLKNQGFSAVVNLRLAKENDYRASDEATAVRKAGLEYSHIPTSGSKPLTDEHLDKITKAVIAHRDSGKVLVHCSSGNRAALWAGGHFFKDHGFDKDEAAKIAKRLGLTKKVPASNLDSYLQKQN